MANNNNKRSFQKGSYITFLRKEEMMEVFKEFLEAHNMRVKGQTSTNILKFNKGTGTVKVESCVDPEYADGVMKVWVDGKPWRDKSVNINEALSYASAHWRETIAQRKAEHYKTSYKPKSPEELAKFEKEKAQRIKESAERNEKLAYESDKAAYLFRLPGAAVAQYLYLAAKARRGEEFHDRQVVKSVDKHPYIKSKGFKLDERDDILIIPQTQPTEELLIKFIKSDKFQMPENIYNLTRDDILNEIVESKSRESKDDIFSIEAVVPKSDFENGTAIIPSRDINGVIVNLQRLLIDDKDSTNKKFLGRAIVNEGFYIFNHELKLSKDYNPKSIVVTEGWATGRAIDKILNNQSDDVMVVVCWNANQLKTSIAKLTNTYTTKPLSIAADNDYKSFALAPYKDIQYVFNTGLRESLIAIEHNIAHKDRISVFTPTLDYTQFNPNNIISDFDDVERQYGTDYTAAMLKNNMLEAIQRRKDNISESDYISRLYNQQAQYYADTHNLPIKGVDPDGVFNKDVRLLDFESTINVKFNVDEANERITKAVEKQKSNQNSQTHSATENNESIEPTPIVQTSLSEIELGSLFRVDVPVEIKTEFEKNLEREVSYINRGIPQLENGSKEPTNETHEEMKNNISREIAAQQSGAYQDQVDHVFIDPKYMAAMLYDQYAQSLLENATSNAFSADDINLNPYELPNETKLLGAILDPTMGKHIGAELERHVENYKEQPFYQDLKAIRSTLTEDLIIHNEESLNLIKTFQREITSAFISKHYDIGIDENVTQRILDSDISKRPTEEKKAFFQGLRNIFKSLEINDKDWIKDLRHTLESTKDAVSSVTKNQTNTNSPSIQNNM